MQPIGTLLVVGAGRMGAALIRRFAAEPGLKAALKVIQPGQEKRQALGVPGFESLAESGPESWAKPVVVVVAVKPQKLPEVLPEYAALQDKIDAVISIAAGKNLAFYEQAFSTEMPICRVMPNLPVLVGQGFSYISLNKAAASKMPALAADLFGLLGEVRVGPESQMDAATAIAGSGPAYLYAVMEAWKKAAISLGFSEDVAADMVRKTVVGAVALQQKENLPEVELVRQVASPGGTTEAALQVFAANQRLESLFAEATQAAVKRAEALST